MRTVDCRGKKCPEPVIMTKKALEESENLQEITVIVDNEVSRENVMKFLKSKGFTAKVEEKEGLYYLFAQKEYVNEGEIKKEKNSYVVLIGKNTFGSGSEELGRVLMRSFMYSLSEAQVLPESIMFVNSGVFLTTEGSELIDILKVFEEKGVKILSCGTCLDYYNLKDKLQVGSITNMYTIVEKMTTFKTITI
ncbi:MAG: sulfurtransferase-like selenium metabolism protein YedF [Thermovenabulum sp.]|uniref:sulfurtransferase-like selenium metabolism protein YedF n=1 Tax=Thermovenabulum sp. TaxID=3100335 RepID=UPI003C7BE042